MSKERDVQEAMARLAQVIDRWGSEAAERCCPCQASAFDTVLLFIKHAYGVELRRQTDAPRTCSHVPKKKELP